MDLKNNQQLKAALDDYLYEMTADLPPEKILGETLVFSPRFSRRMNRLIRKSKKPEKNRTAANPEAIPAAPEQMDSKPYTPANRRKKRLILIAVVITVVAGTFSAVAARDQITGFLLTIYERYSVIVFHNDSDAHGSAAVSDTASQSESDGVTESSGHGLPDAQTVSMPAYIPEGYQQTDKIDTDFFLQVIYADAAGEEIIYERSGSDHVTMTIDTEGTQAEEIMVGQMKGIYYSNKGIQNLIWQDEAFVYTISGPAAREDLFAMAESMY